jgi:hypothetical protein
MTAAPPNAPQGRFDFDIALFRRSMTTTFWLWLAFTALAFLAGKPDVGFGFLIGGAFNLIDIRTLEWFVNLLTMPRSDRAPGHSSRFLTALLVLVLKYPAFFAILYFGLRSKHLSFLNLNALLGFLFLFQGVVVLKVITNAALSWADKQGPG